VERSRSARIFRSGTRSSTGGSNDTESFLTIWSFPEMTPQVKTKSIGSETPSDNEGRALPRVATGRSRGRLGAGPAGLTAAYELCKKGYAVTVLEGDDTVGTVSRAQHVTRNTGSTSGDIASSRKSPLSSHYGRAVRRRLHRRSALSRSLQRKIFNYPLRQRTR